MKRAMAGLAVLIGAWSSAACAGAGVSATAVQPGAPGEASRTVAVDGVSQPAAHVAADIDFMQGMLRHHAQALSMTRLVAERTQTAAIRLIARRIDATQADEMAYMTRWLRDRGVAVDTMSSHAGHDMNDMPMMPGMLSAAELDSLARATGADFDRLFLTFMIKHHEGAIVMVSQLQATPGAGQEPGIFQFASHVDADQRAEIARMRSVLERM